MPEERIALVVDDNEVNRLLARTLLKKLGWQSDEAASGEAALQMLGSGSYTVVLLDISMPGMSGEETCVAMRAMPEGRDIRIVAYTAHAFPEEKARILAAGFDDLVIKPVSMKTLGAVVAPPP